MKYTIVIHRAEQDGGFWGECLELPGCYSQGETLNELMQNMQEAIELYLDEPETEKVNIFPVEEIRELIL